MYIMLNSLISYLNYSYSSSTTTAVPYARISLAAADTIEVMNRRLITAFASMSSAFEIIRDNASSLD